MIDNNLIKDAKQILGERAAEIISSGLNIKRWDNKGLKGCCPFHKDDTPSFSWDKKHNQFKCFGCNATLDIIDYYILIGMDFMEAIQELFKQTNTYFEHDEVKIKGQYKYPIAEANSERVKVEEYLKTRGISKETLDKRSIKQDKKGNIVFEYRNQYGELLLVKYRPSNKVENGNKLWCQPGKDTTPLLFGMDKINTTSPLLICEGEIDSLSAIEAGFINAVSVPFGAGNYTWILHNYEWLEQFEKIIIWSDNDEAGEKMRNETIPRLGEYRCYTVNSPYKDINIHLYKEGKQSVLNAIENAKEVPIKDVVDMANVSEYDINKAEKIKSGINGLDKWISGFVLGTLDVITGINSAGKSTIINQMCVCEPLSQGYKTFIYSGELQLGQLRSWIEFPLAGPSYVMEYDNGANQPIGYYVPREIKETMREWYQGKIFIYNNEDDNTAKSIISKMEELARKYGIKNFVLDNLMMIDLECNESEMLKKQKEFVLSLKRFARRYNAVVHLIAHPRKLQAIQRLSKLDVAGTGDITNLADYVIAIHRVTPKEKQGTDNIAACPFDSILDLFKNRPLGHQDKEIGLHFDIASKRLYGDTDNLNKEYAWTSLNKKISFLECSGQSPWD